MSHGDLPAVRAERGRNAVDGIRVAHYQRAPIDVPDLKGSARMMYSHEEAAVRAKLEYEDIAIATRAESSDLPVVGIAKDLDRPIAESERIAGHGRVKGRRDDSRRFGYHSPHGFQIWQRHTRDRFIAQGIKALTREIQVPGDPGRLAQCLEAVESLSHLPAETAGASTAPARLRKAARGFGSLRAGSASCRRRPAGFCRDR